MTLKSLFLVSYQQSIYQHRLKIQSFLKVRFSISYAKSLLFSHFFFFSLIGEVLSKIDKVYQSWMGVKNTIMQVTYFLNDPMFNFLFYFILYWEKVTSYKKLSHNLNLEVQIVWKIFCLEML